MTESNKLNDTCNNHSEHRTIQDTNYLPMPERDFRDLFGIPIQLGQIKEIYTYGTDDKEVRYVVGYIMSGVLFFPSEALTPEQREFVLKDFAGNADETASVIGNARKEILNQMLAVNCPNRFKH